jgi:hypothetical protein
MSKLLGFYLSPCLFLCIIWEMLNCEKRQIEKKHEYKKLKVS